MAKPDVGDILVVIRKFCSLSRHSLPAAFRNSLQRKEEEKINAHGI